MSTDDPTQKALTEALIELSEATAKFENLTAVATAARKNETEAINNLNKAQKTVDQLICQLKNEAPHESGWNRPKGIEVFNPDGVDL